MKSLAKIGKLCLSLASRRTPLRRNRPHVKSEQYPADKEILLESGTNELEVLVFDVADYTFGINVAKVRSLAGGRNHQSAQGPSVDPRGVQASQPGDSRVSLLDHLGIQPTRQESESTMILTDLNQQQTAFLVDQVERIHRLSWENILAVLGLTPCPIRRSPPWPVARAG